MTEPGAPGEGGAGAATAADSAATGARRRSWVAIAPIAVFAALALIFLLQLVRGGSSDLPSTFIGKPAPATNLEPLVGIDVAGVPVPGITNAAFLGKVTVVNVWGSWCGPCRLEHPYVLALGADERIQVFGINQRDPTQNAVAFLYEVGNPYDAIGVDPTGRASIDWGVYGVPETFILDRAGIVRFKLIGPMDEQRFREVILPEIEALLAEPPPAPAA